MRDIRQLGDEFTYDYRKYLLGQKREVVVEETRGTLTRGLTDTFVPVVIDSCESGGGALTRVNLVRVLDDGRIYSTVCDSERT